MRKKWFVKDTNKEVLDLLVRELQISPIIARLLANRNITEPEEAEKFLNCKLSDLHNPYMFKDIAKAVVRIRRAISQGEKILVFGDYDVDGITSVTLLKTVLRDLGGNVLTYIPNRLEEGYGLNLDACRFAHNNRIGLVICVDCGINAAREIEYLNALDIDSIIVDHHQMYNRSIVKAYAVINPLQDDCIYPFKHLAGVGLAFKLAQAILDSSPEQLIHLLDLVALGTISDIVPQLGENRILTKYGLDTLNSTGRIGLKELIRVSGLRGRDISSGHIGYILGPRINASGRVGSPKAALKLLLADREDEAKKLAEILDKENRNRQKIERKVLQEVIEKIKKEVNFKQQKAIVLAGPNWHPGVIGIVASRIVDKFYRPTAIISLDRNTGKGSARSIGGFNLFEAISKCKKYLARFGGHEAACGFTIYKNNIEKFRLVFNKIVNKTLLPEHLIPRLQADMDMPLSSLTERLIDDIEKLAPYGPKNPLPIFISRGVRIRNTPRPLGKDGIKFWVTDGKITCEAVGFGIEDSFLKMYSDRRLDLAYFPSISIYRNLRSIRLSLEDLKFSQGFE